MSVAFTKEPEVELFDELPDRVVSSHRNLVTPEGLALIEAEVARLQQDVSAMQRALADGHEDDPARAAGLGRDLRYWMARRSSAELVKPIKGHEKVHFGSLVTIEREDGRKQKFRIVGEDQADPTQQLLSHVSPLARALTSKKVGDVVEVNGLDVEVIAIA